MVVELSDYVPVNFICLAVLGLLGLRRLVRMERLYWLRVVLFTCLLWVFVIYLFSLAFEPENHTDYLRLGDESGRYPITET